MREILFRGKRLDNGLWIEECLRQYPNGSAGICCNQMQHTFKVDPETVGQYTGLMDKNGKRIFEGDIVHIWVDQDDDEPIKKYRAIVEFGNPNHEYSWGYQLKMIDTMSYNEDILLWVEMEDGGAFCEVIGNIHDNPELMEEDPQ